MRLRKENEEFNAILSYTVSLSLHEPHLGGWGGTTPHNKKEYITHFMIEDMTLRMKRKEQNLLDP